MYVNLQIQDNDAWQFFRDQFDSLERKKYFTTLHLKDSFFHISCFFKMHEDSKVYLACHHFSVMSSGQYEYMKMNGLKGIPQNSNIILYKSLLIDRPRFWNERISGPATKVPRTMFLFYEVCWEFFNYSEPLFSEKKNTDFQFKESEKQAFDPFKSRLIDASILI